MLRLNTFGGLSIEVPGGRPPGRSAQRRQLALLAMLAVQRHRAITRDKLLGYFWPESPDAEGRHALAQLIYRIRQEFGDATLVSGADNVRTDPSGFSADVIEFLEASERGDLEAATACYRGPFLDGFYLDSSPDFERWVDETRAALASRCATNLSALAHSAASAGRANDAVAWLRRKAALQPLSATAALELMRALAAAGDATGALQQAAVHERLLRSEMNAPPDARVVEYAAQLRATAPLETPGSVVQIANPVPRPPAGPAPALTRSTHPWRAMIAFVVVLVAIVFGFVARHRARGSALAPRLVVLGAIEGPDSALTLAVHEALRSGLEADPVIRVLGEARTRELLHLMARPVDTRINGPVADEIALRAGAGLVVVGTAIPVGNGVTIVVRVLNPASGQARLTLSEQAAARADVIPALVRMQGRIRQEAMGAARDSTVTPLPSVMSSSLAALRDYAVAREALRHNDRELAMRWAEAALGEDSMFPMANYLVGDLAWFYDQQHNAELHLTRALVQSDRLPLKERLLVAARYQELVADHSDSALALWTRLRIAFPNDGLAYDGMAWTYRALGLNAAAAATADTALQLDATNFASSTWNELYALIDIGEIGRARALVQRQPEKFRREYGPILEFFASLRAHDWPNALQAYPETAASYNNPYHHIALLVNGRLADAAKVLQAIRVGYAGRQFLPRAISLQARAELAQGAAVGVGQAAREVLAFLETADLSAAATARLAERSAELAARTQDPSTIAALRRLLLRYDPSHIRPSIQLALMTVDAAAALLRGDYRVAAEAAQAARRGMFHGRSRALAALIEADARAALGETDAAWRLYNDIRNPLPYSPGDIETWAILQPEVARKLHQLHGARPRP